MIDRLTFEANEWVQAHISIDADAQPVFQPLRKIHIPMEETVNREIDKLLQRNILEVMQGPAIRWKASGEPRICLDLGRLNEVSISKCQLLMSTWREFHQVELAEDSRDCITFISNRDLFRFKWLPMDW